MRYKTGGNTSPRGKDNIYFIAHPEEIEQYAEGIAASLLRCRNIALWYDEPNDKECSLDELKQMRLIVVAVTRKFLYEINVARCEILPIAKQLNIPFLPFIIEDNLELEFDRIVGKYHCISMCNIENSQINFYKKVGDYLEKILGNDENRIQIQNAFDMKVFFSYRKKDRTILNDLIQRIHANEECRGIGFWYDEYLVPGESYDDEIDKQIKNCDLVILNLTHYMVDEDNYAIREELPNARDYGKKILAVEMEPGAAEKFFALGAVADYMIQFDNLSSLGNMLEEYLAVNHMRQKNGLQREYLLGLAYLNGINVERDAEYALIKFMACEAVGHEAAIENLINMYACGDSIPLSYKKARIHLRKLIALLEAKLEQSRELVIFIKLLQRFCQLGEYTRMENEYEEARNVFFMAEQLYMKYGEPEDERVLELMVIVYFNLAKLSEVIGDKSNNQMYYKKLDRIHSSQTEGDWKMVNQKIVTMISEGDTSFYEKKIEDAFNKYYLPAFSLAKLNYEENPNNTTLETYAGAIERIADYYRKCGQKEKAKETYIQSMELGRQAFAEAKTVDLARAQFIRYYRIAGCCEDIMEARMYYNKGSHAFSAVINAFPDVKAAAKYTYDLRVFILKLYEEMYRINIAIERVDEAVLCKQQYDSLVEIYTVNHA